MNRQQRRTQQRQDDPLSRLRASVAAAPKDARARNELACALLSQGRLAESSEQFAHALSLMPELLEQYAQIFATLLQVNPALRAAISRLASGSAGPTVFDIWIPPGDFSAVARDPLLRCLLELAPVRDLHLERFLTIARRGLLAVACASRTTDRRDTSHLEFGCALARQCFLNEYVFGTQLDEREQVNELQEKLTAELTARRPVPGVWPALLASYMPLAAIPSAHLLLERSWPSALRAVLRQQLIEPEEERKCRQTIPRLTPIENTISLLVQNQYEENPYPRWVAPISSGEPTTVDAYLHRLFPSANFSKGPASGNTEILVAGCGTGQQSIATARRFIDANVLAVDLSLSSLAYAKRMTDAMKVRNVNYGQADILNLGSLGRSFDVIEASGVLHHMAEPMQGWRSLLALLRSGGFMNVGLYSKTGRQLVQRGREFVAKKGYRPTADDIRRLRQEFLATPLSGLWKWGDYFSTSECRDLLFHVQEHQTTIPEIESFLGEHNLSFIGFHVMPQIADAYRRRFPNDISLTDLSCWNAFEAENPYTFASMYQFWIQKN
jgi:2-polyprenyl-3-methyl-5-hydroxy-6-metoxy-1,4-benzoquinol methylase